MKKPFLISAIAVLAIVACSKQSSSVKHPQPFTQEQLAGHWVYNDTYSDEFETNLLDTTKWYAVNPGWIGRAPSLFLASNVYQKKGQLILRAQREEVPNAPEGYHTFTSAAVQSKTKVLYGFFEIRCQPMNSAISSAFWLYTQDSIKQEEIDIFEICGRNDSTPSYDSTYFATSHYILKKQKVKISDNVTYKSDYRLADSVLVSGLKWTREEIVWYLNGKVIRTRHNDFWHSPETINFDSEAFPTWWGLPTKTDNGGEFKIDYFRYWTKK